MSDYKELRKLALAATPGPWRVGRGSKSRIYAPYHVQPDGHAIARTYGSELNGIGVADLTGPVNIADAAYIAAANPDAVLELLDEVERLRLAEALERNRILPCGDNGNPVKDAATELRRLHAENANLTALLKKAVPHLTDIVRMPNAEWVADAHNKAADALRQALAKAEGDKAREAA